MSCSVYAAVVAGVRVSDHRRLVTMAVTVTKYDPDTGKPYDKVVETTGYRFGQKEFTADEWDAAWEKIRGRGEPLRVYDGEILGFPVARTGDLMYSDRVVQVLTDADVRVAKHEAAAALAEFGLSESDVSLFLVGEINY